MGQLGAASNTTLRAKPAGAAANKVSGSLWASALALASSSWSIAPNSALLGQQARLARALAGALNALAARKGAAIYEIATQKGGTSLIYNVSIFCSPSSKTVPPLCCLAGARELAGRESREFDAASLTVGGGGGANISEQSRLDSTRLGRTTTDDRRPTSSEQRSSERV